LYDISAEAKTHRAELAPALLVVSTNLVEANLVHFALMPGSLNETCYASAESGISVLVKRVLTDHIGNS
jgi:hypothetical protein